VVVVAFSEPWELVTQMKLKLVCYFEILNVFFSKLFFEISY